MNLRPLTLREANRLVATMHRHHRPTRGHRWSTGLEVDGTLVGAAIVGRPLSRRLQNAYTAEVLRVVTDGTPNACSMLYGACWRAWRAMGGTRLITYTLASEPGTSLRAAGARRVAETEEAPAGWDRVSRRRVGVSTAGAQDVLPLDTLAATPQGRKVRWEWTL